MSLMPIKREEDLSAPGVPTQRALVIRPPEGVTIVRALFFVHGFIFGPSCYTALFELLAAQGFAVVLPAVYSITDAVGSEVHDVVAWSVRVVFTFPSVPFVLASHSRGGQASLLGLFEGESNGLRMPPVQAVILLDPIEGSPSAFGLGKLKPFLLENDLALWKLNISTPVLIFGAEMGTKGFFPATPDGHNYETIWGAFKTYVGRQMRISSDPLHMFQIVHTEYGHIDYLNDKGDCVGILETLASLFIQGNATGRAEFRRFVAQAIISFCNAFLCESGDRRPWKMLIHDMEANHSTRVQSLENHAVEIGQ